MTTDLLGWASFTSRQRGPVTSYYIATRTSLERAIVRGSVKFQQIFARGELHVDAFWRDRLGKPLVVKFQCFPGSLKLSQHFIDQRLKRNGKADGEK